MPKYNVKTVITTYFDEVIEASSPQEAEEKYNDMICNEETNEVEDLHKGSWEVVDVFNLEKEDDDEEV